MPQLDVFSYLSVTTTLIGSFIFLLFSLHGYLLPKIAKTLKFRKKYVKSIDNILIQEFEQSQESLSLNKKENWKTLETNEYIHQAEAEINKIITT